jgi:crossover junction endodeoxyribonuclease RuvC
MRLIGLDPGLRVCGWGVIVATGNSLRHVAHGTVRTDDEAGLAERLAQIYRGLNDLIATHRPDAAAVEETFVNRNPASAIKLGEARGVVLLVPALAGLPVAEYPANVIKKSLVGAGHASKHQVVAMIRMLLPGCGVETADAADALAVAVCHAHHAATSSRWQAGSRVAARARA